LKRFATAENCAVILLSGFNRQYITAGDREPRLSDLDGSASIEKDASRVLLIDVPADYTLGGVSYQQNITDNPTDAPRFFTKVIQAKGRNQGTATVGLYFRRETKTFQPINRAA
jgi:replicative DNA helicase